jgi:hypothetical protein
VTRFFTVESGAIFMAVASAAAGCEETNWWQSELGRAKFCGVV